MIKTDAVINDVQRIELPRIQDIRGNLSFIEENKHIPFKIKTAYWICDVPGGEELPGYAVQESGEFIVAISGNLDIILNDGCEERKVSLNRSYFGFYIPAMIWRRIENFSTNSLALILSSNDYVEDDYIRDFEEFMSLKRYGKRS